MARQCPKPKRKRDATWFMDKVLLVEAQRSGKVLNEDDMLNQSVEEMSYSEKTHLKAQQIRPTLYDGSVIAKETNVISIVDFEETLMLEEESRSKMILKQSDPKVLEKKVNIKPINYAELNRLSKYFVNIFISQKELSNEQAFRLKTSDLILTNMLLRLSKLRLLRNFLSSIELAMQLNKEIFQKNNTFLNQTEPLFDQLFELNNLKVEIQAKDIKVKKLKANIKCLNKTSTTNNVKKDIDEIETINIELEHKDKNNREAHIYYLKHTMEQAAIIWEIVKQAKLLNPLDSAPYPACKYVKMIQELLGYVRDTCPDIHKPSEKVIAPINKKKIVSSMNDARHELCFLKFVSDMNASSKSKSVKKAKKKEEWKPTGKVYTKIRYNWRLTGWTFTLVGNAFPLNRIITTNKVPLREPITLEVVAQESILTKVVQIILWYLDSRCSKHMTGDRSQFTNFIHKFLDTVKFGNDQIVMIIGYDDYQIGNITISRVYYVEGLGHNLFSVGQFYDSDLEVAFRKHAFFVRNLEGKSKKQSYKPKSEDTNLETLYLLHMDLCWPMRVASISGKKYILIIVYDHSRFTWVNFLASKHEALDFIIKFLKMIQVRLNTPVMKKCDLSYLYVFGALCYPNNYTEDLGRLQAKADIGLGFQSMTHVTSSSGLVPNPILQPPCIPPPRDDWNCLFQPMFDE
nr:integrase, catalytic region, zinc finger, CCHC-type, peptidase aspartic, catalytic [Tanacetum cinerariifolium]